MTVKSKWVDNRANEDLIQSLAYLISDRNKVELEKIGFSPKDFSHIQNIEFVYPYLGNDKNQIFDSLRRFEPFRIVVYSNEKNNFKKTEKLILSYLENNRQSVVDKENRANRLKETKKSLLTAINSLNNMEQSVNALFLRQSQHALSAIIDPAIVIKEKMNAEIELIKIEEELNTLDNYEVLSSMVPRLSPEYRKDHSMVKFSILFLIIGGILLRSIKKK